MEDILVYRHVVVPMDVWATSMDAMELRMVKLAFVDNHHNVSSIAWSMPGHHIRLHARDFILDFAGPMDGRMYLYPSPWYPTMAPN